MRPEKLARKNAYMEKLINLVETSEQCLIVQVDNVGSRTMQLIRIALRGKAILLMGKNTMIRTALRKRIETCENEELAEGLGRLLAAVNGNMGFIFLSTQYLQDVRDTLLEHRVPAAAKAGVVAPTDVHIPQGPSGLEPSQTSFFQALNIPTKIVKGMIEITSAVHLIKQGEKVSLSAQALLGKLGQKPFEYGMEIREVYQDGCVFDSAVLDISDEVITAKFLKGVANIAALGREIGVPTEAGLPHMMTNAYKNMVALICDVDFVFEQCAEIKAILNDPEALAAMKAAAAAGPAAGAAGGEKKEEAAAAVVEEEEEEDMDFDLFG